ncbi:TolC family protein (plasmid) [Rahnella aquatilis]|uniref:TolC family protein n=1 Tax=Rahnella perminowiae TaxID=2816244 RepID=A0ABS6KZ92_9GAMM|nr:TolC family protein [Rahnella perminowiae]UJD92609.1 TolC family protein [Rahnella aquatilis]
MSKCRLLTLIVLVIPIASYAWSEDRILPSNASRLSQPTSGINTISLNAQTIDLTLSDAISLGLRDNRSIRSVYLDRISQKFDLRVAQDRFTPKLVLSASYLSDRNQDDRYRQGNISPSTTLLTPYGTRFSLGWTGSQTIAKNAGFSGNDGANITVIQPLLRGAGKDITTAPVRLAQLNEQINHLSLKLTVMQTVTKIIMSYRELLQTQGQVKIAQESLERSRQLADVNRAMISAGRMAEFEIVQTLPWLYVCLWCNTLKNPRMNNQWTGYESSNRKLSSNWGSLAVSRLPGSKRFQRLSTASFVRLGSGKVSQLKQGKY